MSVFLLKGQKSVLIDAGVPDQMERLTRGFALSNTHLHEIGRVVALWPHPQKTKLEPQ